MVLAAGTLIAVLGGARAASPPSLDVLLNEPAAAWRRSDLEEELQPTFAALLRAGELAKAPAPVLVVLDMRQIALSTGLTCGGGAAELACTLSFNCLTDPVQERVICDSALFDAMTSMILVFNDPRLGGRGVPEAVLPYADPDPARRPPPPVVPDLGSRERWLMEQLGEIALPILAHEVGHLVEGSAGGMDAALDTEPCRVKPEEAEAEAEADARSMLLARSVRAEGRLSGETAGPIMFNAWLSEIGRARVDQLRTGAGDRPATSVLFPGEHAQLHRRGLIFLGQVYGDDLGSLSTRIGVFMLWEPEWATTGMLLRRGLCGVVPGAVEGGDPEVRTEWILARMTDGDLSVLETGPVNPQLRSATRSAFQALVKALADHDAEAMDLALADLGVVEAGLADRGAMGDLSELTDLLLGLTDREIDRDLALRLVAHTLPLFRLTWRFEEGAALLLREGLRFGDVPGEDVIFALAARRLLNLSQSFPLADPEDEQPSLQALLCSTWAAQRGRASLLAARHLLAWVEEDARREGTRDACLDVVRGEITARYPYDNPESFLAWWEREGAAQGVPLDAALELLSWSQLDHGDHSGALGTIVILGENLAASDRRDEACELYEASAVPFAGLGWPQESAALWMMAMDCRLRVPAVLTSARAAYTRAEALRPALADPELIARLDLASAQMKLYFGDPSGAVDGLDRWLLEHPDADDDLALLGLVHGCVAEALGGGAFDAPSARLRSLARGRTLPLGTDPLVSALRQGWREGLLSEGSAVSLLRYLMTGRPRALVRACGDG